LGKICKSGHSLDQINAHLLASAEDLLVLKFSLVLMERVLLVLIVLPFPAEMTSMALPVIEHT